MADFLKLTEKFLADKFGNDLKISSRVIANSPDFCVIHVRIDDVKCISHIATAVWDTHNTLYPIHLHLSEQKLTLTATLRSIDGRYWSLAFDEAVYARSSGRYLTVVTTDGDEIVCAMTFESLDRIFGNVFIRTHRSYAVNVMHIADLRADSVILKNRQAIPLSRSCADDVKKMWGSILYG
jgi:DNA-binding LytR/AlgR family response regulator